MNAISDPLQVSKLRLVPVRFANKLIFLMVVEREIDPLPTLRRRLFIRGWH